MTPLSTFRRKRLSLKQERDKKLVEAGERLHPWLMHLLDDPCINSDMKRAIIDWSERHYVLKSEQEDQT